MTTKATPIKLLRSQAFRQRPDPNRLLSGQPVVNINEFEPGLFFADTANGLFKVGPTAVGPQAPNSGTTGTGALFNLDLLVVSTSSINEAGQGYAVDDILTLSGGTGSAATLRVISVTSGGAITGVSVETVGSYTSFPASPVAASGGAGTNASFNITGALSSVSVNTPGINFQQNDLLILKGGEGTPAVLRVTGVSGSTITSVVIQSPGSYSILPLSPAEVYDISGPSVPGNTVGEQWMDTTNPNAPGLKVFDGTRWRGITPISNTLWVDVNGDDGNDGTSPQTAKKTIKAALAVATQGTQIRVNSGYYEEANPLVFPFTDVSIVGADLRTTSIELLNKNEDLFQVLKGCYVQNFSFFGEVNLVGGEQVYGIMSFKPTGSGDITESPYVQNCTNFVTNSIGLNVDGSKAGGLKSMVLDSFTQYNPNGIGVKVFNNGYCQVVSMFTICCDKSVLAESGGLVSVTNSNSDFGNYGMYADGTGPLEQSGKLVSSSENNSVFELDTLTTGQIPYVGQVISVGELYYNVSGFEVTNQGSGFTSLPTVSVSIGTGPNAIAAQGVPVIENGKLVAIELASSGQNYKASDTITVTITGGGGLGATATAVKNPVYYTIASRTGTFTPGPGPSSGTIISIQENLPWTPSAGDTVNFYRVSRIIANSHCMEYVGSGTDIDLAIPFGGGQAIQANEVIQVNGGRVAITSTDQLGDFRVGEDLVINQNTGTISGQAFRKSILSIVIPYILALS